MTPSEALIEAGLRFEGAHICESQPHPLLMQLCSSHTQYMVDYKQLGHQNFQERWDTINRILGVSAAEIAAQTWDRQRNDTLEAVADEMFKCWRQSTGHWRIASVKHKFFGGDMCQNEENGIWYSCMIGAD